MVQLTTCWGETLDHSCVLPEYPRPGLVRESYFNLNGGWECGFGREKDSPVYDRRILVPFSPEAPLSGVNHILQPDEYLYYKKIHSAPGLLPGQSPAALWRG